MSTIAPALVFPIPFPVEEGLRGVFFIQAYLSFVASLGAVV